MKEILHAVLIIISVYVVMGFLASIFQFFTKLFSDFSASGSKDASPSAPKPAPASIKSKPPQVIQLGAVAPVSTSKRPAKLELTVDYNARLAGSSYLIVRVRGGPDGGRVGGITYALSCSVNLQQQDHALGDRRSSNVIPEAFKGYYTLNSPLPEDDSWATLAVIPLEQVLPPRGLTSRYQFKCLAYASAGRDFVGSPSPVGHVLVGADFGTILTPPGPGYLDEIDWLSLREELLSFLEGLIQCCEVDLPDKRSMFRSFVESLTPPVTSAARAAMLKVAIERAYISARPDRNLDYRIVDQVRLSKDAVLVEALARLTFHLACREPLASEVRNIFAIIRASYDVNVNGYHIRDVDPLAPSAPFAAPAPTVVASPVVSAFELRLEPVEEAGQVKAAEVHVRGSVGSSLAAKTELDFWLWDETAGDAPFLISSSDIDQVHETAVHHHAWKRDEYDPGRWQSAGVIQFNRFMPPAGGPRRISVAGKIRTKMVVGFFNSVQSARSTPVVMNIPTIGYENIRSVRHRLRYRAFVLAEGLALLSGKGPTYRQDKALKKFAQTMCAGITDRKLAVNFQNDLLTLLDSNVDDSYGGLIRQLDKLAAQAYPELKSQLLEAFVEVMASRKVRSKESRDFLEYSRGVLT
jgi:hypothetical protein